MGWLSDARMPVRRCLAAMGRSLVGQPRRDLLNTGFGRTSPSGLRQCLWCSGP